MGSRTVAHYSNSYGNNDVFVQAGLSDVFTTAANVNNNGYEGLYVFKTPPPSTSPNAFGQLEEEWGSPWDWWDNISYDATFMQVNPTINGNPTPAGFGAANSILGNPDMSSVKGRTYIDTIQGYLNPRLYIALGLGSPTGINEVINASTEVFPNPSTNTLNIVSYAVEINSISVYNLNGQEILTLPVKANQIKLNTSNIPSGIYILDIKSNNSSTKRKLVIK